MHRERAGSSAADSMSIFVDAEDLCSRSAEAPPGYLSLPTPRSAIIGDPEVQTPSTGSAWMPRIDARGAAP